MKRQLYFAYGANLSKNNMAIRCPDAIFVETGCVKGWRFLINTRGVASITQDTTKNVYGAIWSLSQNDEDFLDLFEGVKGGWYKKEYVDVVNQSNETVQCLVYIASDSKSGKPIKDYFLDIIANCKMYEFKKSYVDELEGMH